MAFSASMFRGYARDLPTSGYDATTTQMTAALVKSTWMKDMTVDSWGTIAPGSGTNYETTGSGYARITGITFAVNNVDLGIALTSTSPALTFASFTTTDWQYLVLFNSSTQRNYFCIDSGQLNTSTAQPLTISNVPEPFITIRYI